MSFATSTPTRLNFSNSVCSTQGLSARVRARFFHFSRLNFFARAVSLSLFFPPLWIKKNPKRCCARARDLQPHATKKLTEFSHSQAPFRTAKAFPSLKIENRVVVSSNTSSFSSSSRPSNFSPPPFPSPFFPSRWIQPNPVSLSFLPFLSRAEIKKYYRFVLRVWGESAKRFTD